MLSNAKIHRDHCTDTNYIWYIKSGKKWNTSAPDVAIFYWQRLDKQVLRLEHEQLKSVGVTKYLYFNFDGGLVRPPLGLRHGWVIKSHM